MNTGQDAVDALTQKIIGCAFRVANTLGVGFLEKVYENALVHEMQKAGLAVAQQCSAKVIYDGVVVGTYVADLIVEGTALLEIKAVKALDPAHTAQCINYLRATDLWIGLVLNFGSRKMEIKRLVNGPRP
jgi:hypothetical protein